MAVLLSLYAMFALHPALLGHQAGQGVYLDIPNGGYVDLTRDLGAFKAARDNYFAVATNTAGSMLYAPAVTIPSIYGGLTQPGGYNTVEFPGLAIKRPTVILRPQPFMGTCRIVARVPVMGANPPYSGVYLFAWQTWTNAWDNGDGWQVTVVGSLDQSSPEHVLAMTQNFRDKAFGNTTHLASGQMDASFGQILQGQPGVPSSVVLTFVISNPSTRFPSFCDLNFTVVGDGGI